MEYFFLILLALCPSVASAFVTCQSSSSSTDQFVNSTPCFARRKNNADDGRVNNGDASNEKKGTLRINGILGLAFPVAVALSANAPFIYVILNPPSSEERDAMLVDFCKGDTCTLLGGGSGFGGGDRGGDVIGADALASMPSVEDFEAMARTAAEVADGLVN